MKKKDIMQILHNLYSYGASALKFNSVDNQYSIDDVILLYIFSLDYCFDFFFVTVNTHLRIIILQIVKPYFLMRLPCIQIKHNGIV